MIQKLRNPKTVLYQELKNIVLREHFAWFYNKTSHGDLLESESEWDSFSFFSHTFLARPNEDHPFPQDQSSFLMLANDVFVEIARENNISPQVLYRANANLTIPTETGRCGPPHRDHDFPHKNLLVYLTDTNGGDTVVGDEIYSGKEDDIILFEGEHQGCPPTSDRRVVLVYTFL